MKRTLIAAAAIFLIPWSTRAASAQELEGPTPPVPSISMAYDSYLSAPAPAGPGVPSASPSDRPAQPSAVPPIAAGSVLAPEGAFEEEDEGDEPRRLFDFPFLAKRRIEVRGWLDQSFTWNPDSPRNRFNGPVTFFDRSNDYMLNQLYLITERVTDTEVRLSLPQQRTPKGRVFAIEGIVDIV
ncbi:MAG: porin, partial [Thermoguttaceae bacterium]|nr:porin [Thermoguttaceae bacterium]